MQSTHIEIFTPAQIAAIDGAIRGDADAHIVLTHEQVAAMVASQVAEVVI